MTPDLIASSYRGSLSHHILSMPLKNPMSFETAILMVSDEFSRAVKARKCGYEPGECHWYYKNFVQWISDKGWHIELTGDEFELFSQAGLQFKTAAPPIEFD